MDTSRTTSIKDEFVVGKDIDPKVAESIDRGKWKNVSFASNCIARTREALQCGDRFEFALASQELFFKNSIAMVIVHILDEE